MSGPGNFAFVVLLPTAHRVTIKANSNTSILQVLEDACKKSGLDPQEWDLKHYNRVLELSNSVRFSGLPNNATLEMVQSTKLRKESTVKLGLQLESGKRLMEEFLPSCTLWEVLEHWKNKGEDVLLNELTNADDVLPVCVYMRHEIVGPSNLQDMTLRSLGLTKGSAIIRLLYRSESQLKHQANVSAPLSRTSTKLNDDEKITKDIPETSKEVVAVELGRNNVDSRNIEKVATANYESVQNNIHAELPAENCVPTDNSSLSLPDSISDIRENIDDSHVMPVDTNDAVKYEKEECMELDSETTSSAVPSIVNAQRYSKTGDFYQVGERDAVIYHSDDIIVQNNENIPDDFFAVTLADVDSMYRDLKNKRIALEESPLLTSAQRTLEKDQTILRNIRDHPTTVVRIRFSNRYVLQGTFRTLETIGAVVEFIRKFLENPAADFYLFTTPPKKVLSNETRLVEEGLVGLAVIYFGSQEEVTLKPELFEKLSDPNIIFENLRQSKKLGTSENKMNDASALSVNVTSDGPQQESFLSTSSSTFQNQRDESRTQQPRPSTNRGNITSGKLPKWFKK